MATHQWVEVAFPLQLAQRFTYTVPADLEGAVDVGQRVIAPLGHRNQQGMIVQLLDEEPAHIKAALKDIHALVDPVPVFDAHLVAVLRWISQYYFTPLGKVLQTAIPADARLRKDVVVTATPALEPEDDLASYLARETVARLSSLKRRFGAEIVITQLARLQRRGMIELENEFSYRGEARQDWLIIPDLTRQVEISPRAKVQQRIMTFLNDYPQGIARKDLMAQCECGTAPVQSLLRQGFVRMEPIPPDLDPLKDYHRPPPKEVVLNREQQSALEQVNSALDRTHFTPFTLFGVPGSGKTEIYLEAAAHALEQEKSIIVLVPEIALAPQLAHRFQSRFGEIVALWHSNLRGAERLWTWQQIQKGRARIIIGARSAVLTPVRDLGLIVVDEEQEHSYKQEENEPRYQARDVAVMRAREAEAVVILGSATPSLETYYNLNTDRYQGLYLTKRWEESRPPLVEVVDMNKELEESEDYHNPLSRALQEGITETLAADHQIILFQNRRGYAPFVQCRACGWIMTCPQDEITLTYHKQGNRMRCHYCDFTAPPPAVCPSCKSTELKYGGTGTQRVEEALEEQFPDVPVSRMDMDTTREKGAHQRILGKFARGESQILLGTQMIAKGLDFEKVTLVGVINADSGLHYPDFRARERTFQLVYQVSGRSGRGSFPGRVIIQTWMPDDPAIRSATHQDLKQFYNLELSDRQQLDYPPFSRMVSLGFLGRNRDAVIRAAEGVARQVGRIRGIKLLGPAPSLVERTPRGFYWKLILKSNKEDDETGSDLRQTVRQIEAQWRDRQVRLRIDTDPYQLL